MKRLVVGGRALYLVLCTLNFSSSKCWFAQAAVQLHIQVQSTKHKVQTATDH